MRVFLIVLCFALIPNFGLSEENGIVVLNSFEIDKSQPKGLQEKSRVNVLCIDGYKFVSSYGWSAWSGQSGVGTGAGVSLVQFFEEKEGKIVPAKCVSK